MSDSAVRSSPAEERVKSSEEPGVNQLPQQPLCDLMKE